MLKEYLYELKYYLTRSYVFALVVVSYFIYNGDIDINNYGDILVYFFISWFAFVLLRESLLGSRLIYDTTDIYSGNEDEEGIVEIIKNAQLFLIIVSPFVEFGNNLSRHILDAQERCGDVTLLVSRGKGMKKASIVELNKLKEGGCQIMSNSDLHAKIYLNEKVGII